MLRRAGDHLGRLPSKKKLSNIVLRGAAKIEALVAAAAESIEADGVGCTSELEQTLFRDMNGLCNELMTTLIEEASARHFRYDTEIGERNGGVHAKKMTTLFGETRPIKRTYYYNEELKAGHYPFDEALGLVGRYTPAVADEAIRGAVEHPYADASEEFERNHAFRISPDAIRDIVMQSVGDQRMFGEAEPAEKEGGDGPLDTVCVMADGTGVPLRKSCLRGAKGKNGRAKTREVKAGAMFLASKDEANSPHRDMDTTTYIATTDRARKFGKALRAEFDRRCSRKPATTLYVSDGGKWLHTIHDTYFPFAVEILDVYHAVEHLKPLMLGMGYKENSAEWRNRHSYWKKRIKAGKILSVLDSIWKNQKERMTGDAMREYKYFRSNADRMRYDIYRANGWFIGSGVIESACKTVIGQRFKQSGMIWSLKGAKALLPLRALFKSGRLEEFFRFRIKGLRQVRCVA